MNSSLLFLVLFLAWFTLYFALLIVTVICQDTLVFIFMRLLFRLFFVRLEFEPEDLWYEFLSLKVRLQIRISLNEWTCTMIKRYGKEVPK